jgi:glycosyltransferase involved in cell wall biosynthesis
MNNPLQEFFRCPTEYGNIALKRKPTGQPGFFRFGSNLTCFGRLDSVSTSRSSRSSLRDVSDQLEISNGQIGLPFDLAEVASSLRMETYTGQMTDQETRLGTNPLVRKLYYWTRPILPVSIRSSLQRIRLRGGLNNPFPQWPVDRSVDLLFEQMMIAAIRASGGRYIPFIWFWPQGKQAAFILTHDVEDAAGKAFCPSLMDIDDEYGFKASFQIVPEERYSVEPEYLQQIRDRNFDICVHDLNHDGHLFREYPEFKRRARLINHYCREFGAQGFRSGVLYRNLHWYGDFEFAFDMSVPNVGHLDPQSGGCCTLMPYFIGDILEIPVTLTQDYSLFHILHQYSIDLWKQQVETIVDGHGLVSVIVHPDYVIEPQQQQLYRNFLAHIRQQCAVRDIWATVPSQLNSWWRKRNEMKLSCTPHGWGITGSGSAEARVAYAYIEGDSLAYTFTPPSEAIPSLSAIDGRSAVFPGDTNRDLSDNLNHREAGSTASSAFASSATTELIEPAPEAGEAAGSALERRPLRVAMVSYSFYETDNRVLRYASTLARRGDHVDVFALRGEGKPSEEEIDGVHVHRLQARVLNEKSQLSYGWRICQFLIRAALQVAKSDLHKRYDILHIHSVPDFMVLSALLPKLRGTPVILDIHDILPEFYASKFNSGKKSRIFRILVGVERASCRFASHVIIANDIWRRRLLSRSLTPDKCTVVLNSPDRTIFSGTHNARTQNGKFLMIYPGSLNWHQGLDIAIQAFAKISREIPDAEFHIYGEGPSKNVLLDLVKELGVEQKVKMPPTRSLHEIAQVMATASLGIVPKRKDNFGNEAFSTKILEFMALGVPVIVSDTMIDRLYFDSSTVKFFRSGDVDDLARCMREMIEKPQERQQQAENASRFVETMDWSAKQHEYLELVDRLSVAGSVEKSFDAGENST